MLCCQKHEVGPVETVDGNGLKDLKAEGDCKAMMCCQSREGESVLVTVEMIDNCIEDLNKTNSLKTEEQLSISWHQDSLDATFAEKLQERRKLRIAEREAHEADSSLPEESGKFDMDFSRSSSSMKLSKLQRGSFLEVDHELRAIPLRKSLRLARKIWFGGKCDLWEEAVTVQGYDIFVSHTWFTKGLWKVLSLVFQFGLPWLFVFWFLGVCLAIALCMLDILPMPHVRMLENIPCSTGPWVLIFSAVGSALGLLLSFLIGRPNEMCFIDKVSIHQTDQELKEEGIYGIGGALRCTKELRILWSTPYLSRLWCIFEIAAFRHANPNGRLRLAPLYIESTACAFWLFAYCLGFVFYGMAVWLQRRPSIVETMICFLPSAFLFHALRRNNNSKNKLFSDLRNFRLDRVHCSEEFDKEYVFSAISKWYGSTEAFEEHVRGQLCSEIVSNLKCTHVPASHCFLQATFTTAQGLTSFLSIWKCGAPVDYLLIYLIATILAQCCLWLPVTFKLAFYLCDRFSAPVGGRLCNAFQSFAIYVCWFVVYGVGYQASILAGDGMGASIVLALVASVVACLTFFPFKRRCIPKR